MADRFIVEATIAKVGGGKMFRRRKETTPQRRVTVSGLHDEGMLARANKIKAMFGVQLKEQATLPGISREKTGEFMEEFKGEPSVGGEGSDDRFNVGTPDVFDHPFHVTVFLRGNQLDAAVRREFLPRVSRGERLT